MDQQRSFLILEADYNGPYFAEANNKFVEISSEVIDGANYNLILSEAVDIGTRVNFYKLISELTPKPVSALTFKASIEELQCRAKFYELTTSRDGALDTLDEIILSISTKLIENKGLLLIPIDEDVAALTGNALLDKVKNIDPVEEVAGDFLVITPPPTLNISIKNTMGFLGQLDFILFNLFAVNFSETVTKKDINPIAIDRADTPPVHELDEYYLSSTDLPLNRHNGVLNPLAITLNMDSTDPLIINLYTENPVNLRLVHKDIVGYGVDSMFTKTESVAVVDGKNLIHYIYTQTLFPKEASFTYGEYYWDIVQ